VIFIDTNVFYNIFFDTKFSDFARRFIEKNHNLVTSSTVLNELIFVSIRDLCMERYGTKNYTSLRGSSLPMVMSHLKKRSRQYSAS